MYRTKRPRTTRSSRETALAPGLIVVTRNTRDFERADVEYLNPWSDTCFSGSCGVSAVFRGEPRPNTTLAGRTRHRRNGGTALRRG
jgi:hypothetical protein